MLIQHKCDPSLFPRYNSIYCSEQLLIDETFTLPCEKPDIETLLDVKVYPKIQEFKLFDTPKEKKVFVRGNIEQEILYIADAPCQPVHAAHFTSTFCTFINLPCCCQDYSILDLHGPKILVEFIEARIVNSREIDKCVILFIWYPTEYLQIQPVQKTYPYIHIYRPKTYRDC